MKRREAVKLLPLVGLAGCANPLQSSGGSQAELTLEHVDDAPEEYGLAFSVEVLESALTEDHPPRVEVTIENTGEEKKIQRHSCGGAGRVGHRSDPAGVYLFPSSYAEGVDRVNDRWEFEGDMLVPGRECQLERLEEEGSSRGEYVIWDNGNREGYFPGEEYRFEGAIYVYDADENRRGSFDWGFSASIDS